MVLSKHRPAARRPRLQPAEQWSHADISDSAGEWNHVDVNSGYGRWSDAGTSSSSAEEDHDNVNSSGGPYPGTPSSEDQITKPIAAHPQQNGAAARGRRGRRRRGATALAALPSMPEVAVYTMLAAGVASVVFVAGGRPLSHVGLVLAGAAAVIGILALVTREAGRPTLAEAAQEPTETPAEIHTDRPPPHLDRRPRHSHH